MDQLLPPVSGARHVHGYKNSGIGRETHWAALSHYQQVKTCWSLRR
ncbi:hypothetical protein M8494_11290 [Serratia ureilytica]